MPLLFKGNILLFSYFDTLKYREKLEKFVLENKNVNSVYLDINILGDDTNKLLDGHPSVKGHKLIAEKLLGILMKNINCNKAH